MQSLSKTNVQVPSSKQQAPGCGQLASTHVTLSPCGVPPLAEQSAEKTNVQDPSSKQQAPGWAQLASTQETLSPCGVPPLAEQSAAKTNVQDPSSKQHAPGWTQLASTQETLSPCGVPPLAEQSVYASSKAAVSILTECLGAQLAGHETKLRAAIFYPSGGMLNTGIWTTRRNRPAELARSKEFPEGTEVKFDDFMEGMKKVGIDLPVQDLDELARFAVDGIKKGDFVIMIGRETMEEQLVERARKLARGECPIGLLPHM